MKIQIILPLILSWLLFYGIVTARDQFFDPANFVAPAKTRQQISQAAEFPYITHRIHNNGRFYNTINNNGMTGNFFGFGDNQSNKTAPNFYFPGYSRILHGFYTALWVGGIIGNDTLVSTAIDENYEGWWTPFNSEFWPDTYPFGEIIERSNNLSSPHYSRYALADQEYEAHFTDTFQNEDFVPYSIHDNRSHKPMNLHVTQTSYSWPYKYAEDFTIVDYAIKNIGTDTIKQAWVGVYYVGAVYHTGELPFPRLDDNEGFLKTAKFEINECGEETLNIAWIVDNDGQPNGLSWDFLATQNAFGIAPLRVPAETWQNNFNWWVDFEGAHYNWGPRKKGTVDQPFRDFFGGLGRPLSDRNRYYLLSHPEVDYSSYKAAQNMTDEGWLEPADPDIAEDIADGQLVRFINSYGPFYLLPGQTEHLTVVMAIGEEAHTDPGAYRNMFSYSNPDPLINNLNFDDLITNIRWAKRIYDNPGVDTDNDGDSGRFAYHVLPATGDSVKVFCEGDRIPDFRGATPPPSPKIRVTTEQGRITIRWNGRTIENYFDTFTGIQDFEGYRVYLARSDSENDISLLGSFDREDYSRYKWNDRRKRFENTEIPFTADSLIALYGDNFKPLSYTIAQPFIHSSGTFYFTAVDYNISGLNNPAGIHRLYPDARLDTTDVDEEGRMRYYEYEYIIEDLLPTVPYHVSITAFDFGYPAKSLETLESNQSDNMVKAFAVNQGEAVFKDNNLNVYCYPNPYRVDAGYTEHGFENRFTFLSDDRARNIFFANLPNRCKITIFSIDGDMIKEIEHDQPAGSATASVARFDLVTRNTQALVSGLYYWIVESDYGSQIGKLVVIK